jgi:hypothetical protein
MLSSVLFICQCSMSKEEINHTDQQQIVAL